MALHVVLKKNHVLAWGSECLPRSRESDSRLRGLIIGTAVSSMREPKEWQMSVAVDLDPVVMHVTGAHINKVREHQSSQHTCRINANFKLVYALSCADQSLPRIVRSNVHFNSEVGRTKRPCVNLLATCQKESSIND